MVDKLAAGTYVLAVSGGVDSVVLLDMLAKQPRLKLIVAHFDHGTRPDSADDAQFVKELAAGYGLQYESKREELGANVSEDRARWRRYAFLNDIAGKYNGKIVTAHHADDVLETVAINVTRGTGWRGLAVFDNPNIVRPMLHLSKQVLIDYARMHHLKWHEDSTNQTDTYLRNRLRRKISLLLSENDKKLIRALRDQQVTFKRLIDEETSRLIGTAPYHRHFYTLIHQSTASELLRAVFVQETGTSPTEPQRLLALTAIKLAKPGTTHDVGAGVRLHFTRTEFIVETL